MKIIPALLCLTFLEGVSIVHAGISFWDYIELYPSIGPLEMWQTNDWISADTTIYPFSEKQLAAEELTVSGGDFLNHIDYSLVPWPCMLLRQHDRYFVNIYPEASVTFSVLYQDRYGNSPTTGYPKALYWQENSVDVVELPLDLSETQEASWLYQKQIDLVPGVYWYKYIVKNAQFTEEYTLEPSSFVVTARPQNFRNTSIEEESVVINSKVPLRWDALDPNGKGLTYKLLIGTDINNLSVIYQGTTPSFELISLDSGKRYYWQIQMVNTYGVSAKSPIYTFSTISPVSKSFNYPNPFNPSSQTTRIVFNMVENGAAEVFIYTEFGDLCWHKQFENLPKGANEITYDGKDDSGSILFNGTYICLIKKKYSTKEVKDTCRLLVVK